MFLASATHNMFSWCASHPGASGCADAARACGAQTLSPGLRDSTICSLEGPLVPRYDFWISIQSCYLHFDPSGFDIGKLPSTFCRFLSRPACIGNNCLEKYPLKHSKAFIYIALRGASVRRLPNITTPKRQFFPGPGADSSSNLFFWRGF